MCLSTAYRNEKSSDNVIAQFIQFIDISGNKITLTDVMGSKIELEGSISSVDLSGGVVILNADVA